MVIKIGILVHHMKKKGPVCIMKHKSAGNIIFHNIASKHCKDITRLQENVGNQEKSAR